ncbi:glycosyltransferase family 4 protein [uncultured Acinetobacter sp.]|uniref:glycosyltransferase family 4 protein n=1 Tax=uncultured Acinetobacter sp. TaxID=165433 RepID=UPI0025855AB7|nr:glycosyltransferase family 4 protein [uncultured Acinetobacter sp.]
MNIGLIGPLPDPVNGCSLANKVFVKHANQSGLKVIEINTSVEHIHGNQGEFSWKKVLHFISVYFQLLKILDMDVVYITPGQTFFGVFKYSPFILLSIFLKKPYVIHVHGNYLGTQYSLLKGYKKKIFKFLLSKATFGIVLSKSLIDNFKGILPIENVYIVENFAEDFLIENNPPSKEIKKLKILWLSNLMKEKGIFDFLDALEQLKEKNIDFEAKIAGKIEVGLEDTLAIRFEQLNRFVDYVGTVHGESKKNLLKDANVFVFPTYYSMEGQPISIIEAMATGNIVVSTNHAGIPDIVSNSNGYLIPTKNVEMMVETLEKISNQLETDVLRFSAHNIEYARQNFSEKVFANKIIDVLKHASHQAESHSN